MSALERATQIARSTQARVILPELDDPRIAAASDKLLCEGLANPVPLSDLGDHHIEALTASRPMHDNIAARMLERPLMRSAAMVAAGEADILVAGAIAPSRRVIEAASMVIGLDKDTTTPSSFFLMVMPDASRWFQRCPRRGFWAKQALRFCPILQVIPVAGLR